MSQNAAGEAGKKYYVDIEGTEHTWPDQVISTSQIRELGALPADQGVVEEQSDGSERTLGPDEIVELQPGHRYGRKAKYKRG